MNPFNLNLKSRVANLAFCFFTLGALGACSSVGPYNTKAEGADSELMLKGYDPVAYFKIGKHTLGSPEIKASYEGATYRFVNEQHKALFTADPVKYVPQFGGYCSNGVVYGMAFGGDPDAWQIIDGKLYMFGGAGSRKYFLMDEKKNLELAHHYWTTELKGTSGIMRYYRLVARVPHYKTGAQLEAEWQQKQGAKPNVQ
jgi:YHS domain-containing protein